MTGKKEIKEEEERVSYTIDTTDDPRDRITEEESKLLAELKQDPISSGYDDKTLMIFIIARGYSVKKALERLKAYQKFCKDNGYEGRVVKLSDLNQKLVQSMYAFGIPGTKALNGSIINYLNPGKIFMKEYTVEEIFDHGFYMWQLALREPLECHREGAIYVEDVSTTSLKNMDTSKNKRLKDIQNAFPIKVKAILILKSGFFIRALMAFAKLFVKSKILKRTIALKSPEKVFEWIDPANLHKDYGGQAEFSYEDLPEDPTLSTPS